VVNYAVCDDDAWIASSARRSCMLHIICLRIQ